MFVTAFVLLILCDLPWLYATSAYSSRMITKIQGSPLRFSLWPAVIVYLALAFLMTKMKSAKEAFCFGVATYAVYDFTTLAIFKEYDPIFAVADSLWGGVLFYAVKTILDKWIIGPM